MKKRLEAELISIAHRILKLKNKSELIQLHQETQKLYEALSVLRFVEQNMGIIQPKMNVADIEEKLETAFDKEEPILSAPISENVNVEIEPELKADFESEAILSNQDLDENDILEDKEEQVVATPLEVKEEIFTPAFELQKEEEVENELEIETKQEPAQISFEDLLGHQYSEPIFEKVSDIKPEPEIVFEEKPEEIAKPEEIEIVETKQITTEKVAAGITIGLNDRVGFVKQLFGDSNEDFNRVLSQLSTFDNFVEAKDFIEDMVKPDYNDWKGKEDFEERFIAIISQKFN
jgi:hypothetical protein